MILTAANNAALASTTRASSASTKRVTRRSIDMPSLGDALLESPSSRHDVTLIRRPINVITENLDGLDA